MPAFFFNKTYRMILNSIVRDMQNTTLGDWCTNNKVRPIIVKDMTVLNNHHYRQTKFISECIQHLDEHIVVNPELVIERNWTTASDDSSKPWKFMEPSSVLNFLQDFQSNMDDPTTCVQISRLKFGSIEDRSQYHNSRIPHAHFNINRLETDGSTMRHIQMNAIICKCRKEMNCLEIMCIVFIGRVDPSALPKSLELRNEGVRYDTSCVGHKVFKCSPAARLQVIITTDLE
jgi:hypothetical protein